MDILEWLKAPANSVLRRLTSDQHQKLLEYVTAQPVCQAIPLELEAGYPFFTFPVPVAGDSRPRIKMEDRESDDILHTFYSRFQMPSVESLEDLMEFLEEYASEVEERYEGEECQSCPSYKYYDYIEEDENDWDSEYYEKQSALRDPDSQEDDEEDFLPDYLDPDDWT